MLEQPFMHLGESGSGRPEGIEFLSETRLKPIQGLVGIHMEVGGFGQACGKKSIGPHGLHTLLEFGDFAFGLVPPCRLVEEVSLFPRRPGRQDEKHGQGCNEEAETSEDPRPDGVVPRPHVQPPPSSLRWALHHSSRS